MSKKIWGFSGNGHDASFAVFYDNELMETYYSKEKFHKYDDIKAARKKYGAPDLVVWYENPYLKALRQLLAGQNNVIRRNNVRRYLDILGIECKWTFVNHHKGHAGWYYRSPFYENNEDALVFVIDAIGEFDCTTVWKASEGKLKRLGSVRYPDSLGLFYASMTQEAGWHPMKDEGYTSSFFHHEDEEWQEGHGRPNVNVRNKIFKDLIVDHPWKPMFYRNMHRGLGGNYFGSFPKDYEIAYEAQYAFNCLLIRMVEYWETKTGISNFIFSGGCAFNSHIKKIYLNAWIPENPGDGGSCVGSVHAKLGK